MLMSQLTVLLTPGDHVSSVRPYSLPAGLFLQYIRHLLSEVGGSGFPMRRAGHTSWHARAERRMSIASNAMRELPVSAGTSAVEVWSRAFHRPTGAPAVCCVWRWVVLSSAQPQAQQGGGRSAAQLPTGPRLYPDSRVCILRTCMQEEV